MRIIFGIVLLLAAPAQAAGEGMTVSEFLTRVEALQKKGVAALFSSDIALLKKEVTTSAIELREAQEAARRAGRKPATCMPEKASVNSNELLGYFRAIPPAQRSMSVAAGFSGLIRKKYPCPL